MEKGLTPPPLMENSIKRMFFFIETFPNAMFAVKFRSNQSKLLVEIDLLITTVNNHL